MHTVADEQTIKEYEDYISVNGIDENIINNFIQASQILISKDLEYGLKICARTKEVIETFVFQHTNGTIWDLEKYMFENKTSYDIVKKYYQILLLEAQNKVVDSFFRYIERKRAPKERFYMPRRKQFLKMGLVDALQGMIDDKYDILCISLVTGAGKTRYYTNVL